MKTPARIIEFLWKNQTATAEDLGRGLGLTGANIRHHLSRMQAEDQLAVVSLRTEGRGRPTKVYRLSEQRLGNGLEDLLAALLAAWLDHLPDHDREDALRSIAEQLGGPRDQGLLTSIPRKLALVVDRLNVLHYRSRWEAGPSGARVILSHCPYSGIVGRHPELCRMDAYLLQSQSGMVARQLVKLEGNKEGIPRCIFALG